MGRSRERDAKPEAAQAEQLPAEEPEDPKREEREGREGEEAPAEPTDAEMEANTADDLSGDPEKGEHYPTNPSPQHVETDPESGEETATAGPGDPEEEAAPKDR